MNTSQQYDAVVDSCKDIFIKKTKDYGSSWRVLRTISVVDQLYIKTQRIRNLQMIVSQKVEDDIPSEFKAIVNYGIIGLIQLSINRPVVEELSVERVDGLYSKQITVVKSLMTAKNHDYGEAWREMSQESFADLILTKLLRIKQILANDGKTIISEGIDANYSDIINYAIFALIKESENGQKKK